ILLPSGGLTSTYTYQYRRKARLDRHRKGLIDGLDWPTDCRLILYTEYRRNRPTYTTDYQRNRPTYTTDYRRNWQTYTTTDRIDRLRLPTTLSTESTNICCLLQP
ncbi:unnamed protein product, partial [Laminaria digitata]